MRPLSILLFFACSAALASAQTTLFSAGFEDYTAEANLPNGWSQNNPEQSTIVENPSAGGVNGSGLVLQFVNGVYESVVTPGLSLDGFTSGYTFTLSFTLYADAATNNHNLLIGFGPDGAGPTAWAISSTQVNFGNYRADLVGAGIWQTFTFDVTPEITSHLVSYSATDFRIFMENYPNGPTPGATLYLDNLTLTASAIPEPSTYAALLGAGALGFAACRRRMKLPVVRSSPSARSR